MSTFLARMKEILDFPLFSLHGSVFTIGTSLYIVIALAALIILSGRLKKWIVSGPLAKKHSDLGFRTAFGTIIRYIIVVIGFIVIIETAGVNLSSLTILAGALGIGIGFGLQNVTNNFVCGLIILFERPIKVGDRIEVGQIIGEVTKISPRATTVQSNDNISFIIPNSEFIMSRVINWSYSDLNVRVSVEVGVSYNSDPENVKRLLLDVAGEQPGVLKQPVPDVVFMRFGDSSLDFELRVWTTSFIANPNVLKSELYFAIWKKFKGNGVEIPYPQRDIHLKDALTNVRHPAPEEG
jgi:small-conductance mechanosensitive channel